MGTGTIGRRRFANAMRSLIYPPFGRKQLGIGSRLDLRSPERLRNGATPRKRLRTIPASRAAEKRDAPECPAAQPASEASPCAGRRLEMAQAKGWATRTHLERFAGLAYSNPGAGHGSAVTT